MLSCCNQVLNDTEVYIISLTPYRTIEYGICPICGIEKLKDIKRYSNGIEKAKEFRGIAATDEFLRWRSLIKFIRNDSFYAKDMCYGEGIRTSKKDNQGNPIYKQIRKNFFNQSETIGEVKTTILYV